jgi:hypothetical protein
LEASDQSICLSPGKSFLASRAHQRISVSVPASIVSIFGQIPPSTPFSP